MNLVWVAANLGSWGLFDVFGSLELFEVGFILCKLGLVCATRWCPVREGLRLATSLLFDFVISQNTLPPSLVEYQRLRCRVAFHALSFRNEILALRHQMVQSSCCSWRAACCLLTEMTEVLLLKVEACIRPVCRSFDLYQTCLFKKLIPGWL